MTENNPMFSPEYLNFKDEITAHIRAAQYEALLVVKTDTGMGFSHHETMTLNTTVYFADLFAS